jgi:ribokinase
MIVVFGSVGVDIVTNVARIPRPGETMACDGYVVVPGTKGANQAVAAARAGSAVTHVATCGDDAFGHVAVSIMKESGVDLSHLAIIPKPTGVCLIVVDAQAENTVVAAAGANLETRLAQLSDCPFGAGDTVILQREIPDRDTYAAVALAKARGARVVFNVAPAGPVPAEVLRDVDVLIVNEHELLAVAEAVGIDGGDPKIASCQLSARFGCATIVTLGPLGALSWQDGTFAAIPAPAVIPRDTTAAGDSFTGAFAAALDQGMDFVTAVTRGVISGSISCTRAGAQPSIPTKAEIDAFSPSASRMTA